jgi:hypothetical protein
MNVSTLPAIPVSGYTALSAPQVPFDISQEAIPANSQPLVFDNGETLPEIQNTGSYDSAALKEDTGSGNIPVKMATAIYALNHSFDIQKQALDLLI